MRKYFWKKALSLILVAAMTVSLASCGKKTPVSQPEITLSIDKLSDSEPIVKVVESAPVEESIYDAEIEAPAEETDREVASVEETTIVVPEKKAETVKEADIVETLIEKNLSSNSQSESSANPYINEKNELTAPFDIVYPEAEVAYAGNSLLLKMKNGFNGQLTKSLQDAGVGAIEKMFEVETGTWYTGYIYKDTQVENVLANVRELSNVAVAELNYAFESTASTIGDYVGTNPQADEQWYLKKYGVVETYDKCDEMGIPVGGDSSVVVAIIDTGVDYDHIDLRTNMWKNTAEIPDNGIDDDHNGYVDDYFGVNVLAGKGNGDDDHGHGTHVAGIVAAANNGEGVAGVAYNTKLMAIKAGDASGIFLQSNVAKAVLYAYENGAEVINMSFGGSASTIAVQDALQVAYGRCVLVASAGNDGVPNQLADFYLPSPNYPAALSYVIGVMSVGQSGIESSFSNWDTVLFNNVEYEVYAPGEQILSTIPDDRYAYLSGTSMAAPFVAAQAAILRSYYRDRNIYPTKFIYGQIVGTAATRAICCNPSKHTVSGSVHNMPGIVDLYSSMVDIPKPDVSVCDYTIFDTEVFTTDVNGIASESKDFNNGDGIVDAGEIIALGFTLRNRWGMSKDTIVSIDATSSLGMANPYITILNNDLNYGSVGTYSENDSGKIYKDGEVWSGWENPFYIKVSSDAPNNSTVSFDINVTCKNALNPADETVYSSTYKVLLVIRRGTVLPYMISEDTVLTKDNYYIVPNSMMISEGVTLTAEAGTKIQFWCSDPSDAYADSSIAYIKVAGKFICNGTAEEPVEIFPSDWMSQYIVEIYPAARGVIEMTHTKVTNPVISIDKAVNCEFIQNYRSTMYRRYLSSGVVRTNSSNSPIVSIRYAEECAFYKLNSPNSTKSVGGRSFDTCVCGTFANCIFVDCELDFNIRLASFNNCVFYGNNATWDGVSNASSFSPVDDAAFSVRKLIYNEEDGTTYLLCSMGAYRAYAYSTLKSLMPIVKFLGATYGSFESIDEYNYLLAKGMDNYTIGAYFDNGKAYDFYGNEIPSGIELQYTEAALATCHVREDQGSHFASGKLYIGTWETAAFDTLLEIPGKIFVNDIKLQEYLVNIDVDSTYQIGALLTPVTADASELLYESEDESIATVDENGVVTPVTTGSTKIYVYSSDRAVSNYLTINVKDVVDLTSIEVVQDNSMLEVGDKVQLKVKFTPANTTKKAVSYSSSDEAVIVVDSFGNIEAKSEGQATVTVTAFGGITETIDYRVIIPATGLAFESNMYVTSLEKDDDNAFYPVITPANASIKTITWESADPSTCYVDEDGKLVKLKTGVTSLRAKLDNTSFYADVKVAIKEHEGTAKIVDMEEFGEDTYYAVDSEGAVWVWGSDAVPVPKVLISEGVVDICVGRYSGDASLFALDTNGEVTYYPINTNTYLLGVGRKIPLSNIASLSTGRHYNGSSPFFAVDTNGVVFCWGNNDKCGLGLSASRSSVSYLNPQRSELGDAGKIVKVVTQSNYRTALFLDENGNVYQVGGSMQYAEAHLVETGAIDIHADDFTTSYIIIEKEDSFVLYDVEGRSATVPKTLEYKGVNYPVNYRNYSYIYSINEGKVIVSTNYSYLWGISPAPATWSVGEVSNITEAEKVYVFEHNIFIQESDGDFYAIGEGDSYRLGTGDKSNATVPAKVSFGAVMGSSSFEVIGTNIISNTFEEITTNTLQQNKIVITFSDIIGSSAYYSNIVVTDSSMNEKVIKKTRDFNRLIIDLPNDMVPGQNYTLKIPADAIKNQVSEGNALYTVSFLYDVPIGEDGDLGESGESGDDGGPEASEEPVENQAVVDQSILDSRYITAEDIETLWRELSITKGYNVRFYSNVILNRLNDDRVETWMRVQAPTMSSAQSYSSISLGLNYWGTTNEELINLQILDFEDFQTLTDILTGEVLTEIPEDVWPVVTSAYLLVENEKVVEVGNQEVTFVVEFNRDMDTSIPLSVAFGSSYPYNDYQVEGDYATPRKWAGTVTLTTLIENGYECFRISDGKAADADMKLYTDWGRFQFKIDTSAAQALLMQGVAKDTGIELTWTQDDFDTLAGYNVYRSNKLDGQYSRINRTVIPADTKTFFDENVEPGTVYYYNFTVVKSDLSESEPSGKISLMSKDTMAPNIYHSPIYNAFTGSNIVVTATVTDNVAVESARVLYRTKGAEEWKTVQMSKANDKYSAIIPSSDISVAGLEYYIIATDGISEATRGSEEEPFDVMVQLGVNDNELGDVDGNGVIELKDALMILMARNNKVNLSAAEFARADLNGDGELAAAEALKILMYVNGSITSVLN